MQQAAFLCSLTKAVLPVSHFKERKETNCLNCNAEVVGRYCYVCGQQNTPPKQSVGHLIKHFFDDITHFDGKFFATLKTLIWRPGVLTAEFVRGRKMSYVDPAKMYIFTSAFFFLVFFNRLHVEKALEIEDSETAVYKVNHMNDSALRAYSLKRYDTLLPRDTLIQKARERDSINQNSAIFNFYTTHQPTAAAYDSVQFTLPAGQRDGLWKRNVIRTQLRLQAARRADPKHFFGKLIGRFIHFLPQTLFISLPLFALLLKLLYRRRKNFYYTDHVIFSLHLYIFTFIAILVQFLLAELEYRTGYSAISYLQTLVILSIFIYQYKAMRVFYQQRRGKTVLKFLLLNVLSLFLMTFLSIISFIFSSATFE